MSRIASKQNGRVAAGPADRFFQFSLLGLVASGYLAVAGSGYLDAVTLVATGTAILARLLLVATGRRFPVGEPYLTILTIAYIGFFPLDLFFVSGEFLPATVHLVLFLAVVKILTAETGRDYLYVVVIAFLELLAASMLSARLNYFVFLALFLVFAVATFASWEIRRAGRGARLVFRRRPGGLLSWRLAGLAAVTSVGILGITAVLFFVLPRTARAAFDRLVPERFHVTAFSNRVTLGEIGEVKQQSTVLMHVRIPGTGGVIHLKWRGNALAEFDGRHWYNSTDPGEPLRVTSTLLRVADDDQRRRVGRRLNYEVQLKSFASDTLFIAGDPEFIRIDAPLVIRTRTGRFRIGAPPHGVLRYGVYAYIEEGAPASLPPELPTEERQRYLALPQLDPRIARLARQVTMSADGVEAKARAIERHLQTHYGYTIELPKHEEAHPIAHFLFARREGHCEYFASAMAVMLRSIGIPSRVVTGFQSGIYNPISHWHMIRASDAHSWVEAFLPGSGWRTFDPTPPGDAGPDNGLLSRMSLFFDAADTFWQEWVLNYDLNRQLFLASRVQNSRRHFSLDWGGLSNVWNKWRATTVSWIVANARALVTVVVILAGIILAVPLVWRWWNGRQHRQRLATGHALASDATLMYLRALEMLGRRGYIKPAWLTPGEFVRQVPATVAPAMESLTAAYQDLRFGGRPEAAGRLALSLLELEQVLGAKSV